MTYSLVEVLPLQPGHHVIAHTYDQPALALRAAV